MLDVNKAAKALEDYFATVTTEQFEVDLRNFCPELFEDEDQNEELKELTPIEIYQKAQDEHKLAIAPKLLAKGLSREEVTQILELDPKRLLDRSTR